MNKPDEWSAFANLLGNLILKYADVLDLEALGTPDKEAAEADNKGEDHAEGIASKKDI